MKPAVFIVIIIGILVASGVFLTRDDSEPATTSGGEEVAVSETLRAENNEPFTEDFGTLRALFEAGETIECEYEDLSNPDVKSSGTVYVSGESFRVKAEIIDVAGDTFSSGMIFDEEIVHAWTYGPEDEVFGFTFPATQRDVLRNSDNNQATQNSVALNDEVSLKCRPWVVDASVFVPPSDIEYFDPTAMFAPPGV